MFEAMTHLPEIETVPLFPQLALELTGFLRRLARADWERPTVLPTWNVKDIVAHLVYTLLRKLSGGRDGYQARLEEPVDRDYERLVQRITEGADAWEYTERRHHQMQIRDVFGDLGIQTPALYRPVMETFMRALPHHYRDVDAPPGTTVRITVAGDAGWTPRWLRMFFPWSA